MSRTRLDCAAHRIPQVPSQSNRDVEADVIALGTDEARNHTRTPGRAPSARERARDRAALSADDPDDVHRYRIYTLNIDDLPNVATARFSLKRQAESHSATTLTSDQPRRPGSDTLKVVHL